MSKGRLLRARIDERGLIQVMAAHSPLSARLAEEAGFDGIWASGSSSPHSIRSPT